jgi:hypothetical protein
MTSFSPRKRKDFIAADPFEALIEKQFVNNETVFVLDDGTILRTSDGTIETSSI